MKRMEDYVIKYWISETMYFSFKINNRDIT